MTGYNVVYEYAGKQYTAQMASDPGAWVRLQVVLLGGTSAPASTSAPQAAAPTTYPIR